MIKPLIVLVAVLILAPRPVHCQTGAKAVADSPLPRICQLSEGEKNSHVGLDANLRGAVREDARFMTALKSKEAVWQTCVNESLQCTCEMKVTKKGLGLSCSPHEKGLIRKATQEWHVIGAKELEAQFFEVEKVGDDYALTDLCLAKIKVSWVSDKVDMIWQDYNLAGEIASMKRNIRAVQAKNKLLEISGRLKPYRLP